MAMLNNQMVSPVASCKTHDPSMTHEVNHPSGFVELFWDPPTNHHSSEGEQVVTIYPDACIARTQ